MGSLSWDGWHCDGSGLQSGLLLQRTFVYSDLYRLSLKFMRFETSKHDEVASKFIGNISVRNATKKIYKNR